MGEVKREELSQAVLRDRDWLDTTTTRHWTSKRGYRLECDVLTNVQECRRFLRRMSFCADRCKFVCLTLSCKIVEYLACVQRVA